MTSVTDKLALETSGADCPFILCTSAVLSSFRFCFKAPPLANGAQTWPSQHSRVTSVTQMPTSGAMAGPAAPAQSRRDADRTSYNAFVRLRVRGSSRTRRIARRSDSVSSCCYGALTDAVHCWSEVAEEGPHSQRRRRARPRSPPRKARRRRRASARKPRYRTNGGREPCVDR